MIIIIIIITIIFIFMFIFIFMVIIVIIHIFTNRFWGLSSQQVIFVLLVTAIGTSLWQRFNDILSSPKGLLFLAQGITGRSVFVCLLLEKWRKKLGYLRISGEQLVYLQERIFETIMASSSIQ